MEEGRHNHEGENQYRWGGSIFSSSWKAMGQDFYTMKMKVKDMTRSGESEGLVIREVVE